LISESAWEEMTCLFAPSLAFFIFRRYIFSVAAKPQPELAFRIITSVGSDVCSATGAACARPFNGGSGRGFERSAGS
ncbi:hypothetical protein M4C12_25190, partial [Klebsiella pneumoniae]|nr:hypothetical protein [Klebsiella pneumoniae]